MALHNTMQRVFSRSFGAKNLILARFSSHGPGAELTPQLFLDFIGKREVVGFGMNGLPTYSDKGDMPMPAIRFKEVTPEIQALREKELGDWKAMTIEEKKALYRASYCQTFAEFEAPNSYWKIVIGTIFGGLGMALSMMMLLKIYIFPPLPASFDPENQRKQLKFMIDIRSDPFSGIGSKWDYDNNRWK